MTNCHPETGVRYGVIACNSLDPDLVTELFYGQQATNVSYDEAYADAKREAEKEFEDLVDQAEIAANETDPNMGEGDFQTFVDKWLFDNCGEDTEEGFVELRLDQFADQCEIDEPTIQGTLEGVEYQITWLGGAPLLWVLKGPQGWANQLCSPCVPNAANLDDGYTLTTEPRHQDEGDFLCYCTPRDWLYVEPAQRSLNLQGEPAC